MIESVTETGIMRSLDSEDDDYCNDYGSQDSVVHIVTGLWTGQSGVPIPWGKEIFFFSKTSRPALGPTQPTYNGYQYNRTLLVTIFINLIYIKLRDYSLQRFNFI
jgi:hypothetical protein